MALTPLSTPYKKDLKSPVYLAKLTENYAENSIIPKSL